MPTRAQRIVKSLVPSGLEPRPLCSRGLLARALRPAMLSLCRPATEEKKPKPRLEARALGEQT